MNRDQSYILIQQTFTQGFEKTRFRNFAVNLLNRIDESKAQAWNSTYVKDAFKNHVARYERLGTYTSPDKEKLDVLVVHLTQDSKLERARTVIRNFVADHLKNRDEKDAALVAFVSPSETSWRFSYIKMEYATVEKDSGKVDTVTRLTSARRFSYIVGAGESCHTAQTRFLNLLQDITTDPTLAALEEAFSVEAVTKEFFKRYVGLFENIHEALEKITKRNKDIRDEFQSKNVNTVDFAKKLMGQIVFLYFLQKKGWLGVAKGKGWGTGPHNFLRRLAEGKYGASDNYFNNILEPLFYDTLATDRGHEAWCKHFNCRIPFLNGGLFEALGGYDWQKNDILLPNRLFYNNDSVEEGITGTGVLDVFDRYNFTVNEAEPLEKEVAIDPEMLGKVFENLIEDNRRKGLGAFYTPREGVHYMCQQSLINYLDTALNADKQRVPRTDLETFIYLGEQISHYESVDTKYRGREMPNSIKKYAQQIDAALADIAVCDPAVGSGAFPVGMMTEIVRARLALNHYIEDTTERIPYHFKRHAIQHCLYGVDIDAGAVEIAKLRLWLSLVVDEEDVEHINPLPNLDYKIVTGNSLLGVEKNLFNNELFIQLEKLKPQYFDETDAKKKAALKAKIDDLIHHLTTGKEIFDFEIYFSEVFHKKGGFDVVVANPPYISYGLRGGQKMSKEDKAYLKKKFADSAEYKISMYSIFMEIGIRLSSANGGVSCFIVPDSFVLGMYFSKIRSFILRQCDIKQIVMLPFSVFKAAVGFSVVYLFEKNNHNHGKNTVRSITANSCDGLERGRTKEFSYQQEYFHSQRRFKFRLFFEKQTFDIIEKCRAGATPLEKIVGFSSGLIGLDGQESITSDSKRGSKWLPGILSGGDIHKYIILAPRSYILFDKTHIKSGYDCVDYSVPKLLMRQTGDSLICAYDTTGILCLNNVHVGNSKRANTNLKFVCGLLNSKLMNFFYQAISLEVGRVMPQTDIETLDDLPIKITHEIEGKIAQLTDAVIVNLEKGQTEKAQIFADRIDLLVYELYCLTEDEIAIVEGKSS